jgi:hypothetical protein
MKTTPPKNFVRETILILASALLLSLLYNTVSPKSIKILPVKTTAAENVRP